MQTVATGTSLRLWKGEKKLLQAFPLPKKNQVVGKNSYRVAKNKDTKNLRYEKKRHGKKKILPRRYLFFPRIFFFSYGYVVGKRVYHGTVWMSQRTLCKTAHCNCAPMCPDVLLFFDQLFFHVSQNEPDCPRLSQNEPDCPRLSQKEMGNLSHLSNLFPLTPI